MPTARAVRIREPGGPDVLDIGTLEVPDPCRHEVLVEVAASAINRADLLQRRGLYPAPPGAPPDVPGLEYAGHVAAVGPGVRSVQVGDRVMGITGGGGQATLLVAHERTLVRVPSSVDSIEHAAAIPEAFMTAFDALFEQGELTAGQRVLIHAVASGVGTAALQLAEAAGAEVIGTSRTAEKLQRCAELGAFVPVEVRDGRFADAIKTQGGAVDVVLDMVGAAYLDENLRALATKGRMIVIGLMGGAQGEISLGRLLRARVRIQGSVLRARPLEEKAHLASRFSARVVPQFVRGALRPVVDEILPMSAIVEAHERLERNQTFGKLVMRWD